MTALWTFLRGLFAIFLGAILFFQPDKGLPLLTTFMGGFWIGSGLLSVRWGMGKEHSKLLTIVVGAIGIIAGAIAIGSRSSPAFYIFRDGCRLNMQRCTAHGQGLCWAYLKSAWG